MILPVDHSLDDKSVVRVTYTWSNISKGTLAVIGIWYAIWVPMCAVVIYVLYHDTTNYFLWCWMLFGTAGLVLVPLSFLEIFTSYVFTSNSAECRVAWSNVFHHREMVIPREDVVGFAFDDDEGHESDQLSLVFRRHGKMSRQRLLTFLIKPEKVRLIESLQWGRTPA